MKFQGLIVALVLLSACNLSVSEDLQQRNKDVIVDDLPIDYRSAEEALQHLPNRPGIESTQEIAPGIKVYSSGVAELTVWYAFDKGNEAYPAVVRKRIVGPPDNFVVKTAILCGASQEVCAKLSSQVAALQR